MAARAPLAEAEAAVADLPDLDAARAGVEAVRMTVEAARMAMLTRRSAQDEVRREGEARVRRRQEALKEVSGWRHRLETAEKRTAELAERQAEAEEELAEALLAPGGDRRSGARTWPRPSRRPRRGAGWQPMRWPRPKPRCARRRRPSARPSARQARRAKARARAEAQRKRRARTVAAASRAHRARRPGSDPAELLETLGADPDRMPDAETLETEVNRLKRQREALGAVNLRAEEDAKTVQAEHDTLASEKFDLEEAVKKLRAGIAGLNREGRERLLTAFEQVNANFATLFTHLFGGGEARLVLVESDDPLEAGLEIMCQPPGKKLATLSLLSGGEQTLTALALIFGVFLANPAPICVLDEVDAPLDDANVTRFCDMLDEMTRRTDTRFLVITHHAVTMARMDRLFGVTMVEQGVSQLVSVDLKKAEALVA